MTRAAFTAAGGNPDLLPLYLNWHYAAGYNGGGYWVPSPTLPASGYYLQLGLTDSTYIAYAAHYLAP
jgi:hypothetical protein